MSGQVEAEQAEYVITIKEFFDNKFRQLKDHLRENPNDNFQELIDKLPEEFLYKRKIYEVLNLDGKTFLHFAVQEKDLCLVNFLLAAGFDPDYSDLNHLTPLYYACDNLDLAIVDSLLRHNANPNLGYGERIPLIATIESQATIDANSLSTASGGIDFSHLSNRELIEQAGGRIVSKLINHNVNINLQTGEDRLSAAHRAVALHRLSILKVLVENNVDLTLLTTDGMSVLHSIVEYRTRYEKTIAQDDMLREKAMAELIIPRSGAVYALQAAYGNTPAHHAVIGSNPEVVELFFKLDYLFPQLKLLSIQNHEGNTPIHEAVAEARRGPKVLKTLLRLATEDDLAIVNKQGQSVLAMAELLSIETRIVLNLAKTTKALFELFEDSFIGSNENPEMSVTDERFTRFVGSFQELEDCEWLDNDSEKISMGITKVDHYLTEIQRMDKVTATNVDWLSEEVTTLLENINIKYPSSYLETLEEVKGEKYIEWKKSELKKTSSFSLLENFPHYQNDLNEAHDKYNEAIGLLDIDFKKNAKTELQQSIDKYIRLKEYFFLELPYRALVSLSINTPNEIIDFERQQHAILRSSTATDQMKLQANFALASLYRVLREKLIQDSTFLPTTEDELFSRESFYYSEAYKFTQGAIDSDAHVVLQREIGISQGEKLGTYNIQQCVAVIAHDPVSNKVVLSHFDRFSGPLKFIDQILAEFPQASEHSKIDIYITGGRDRSVDLGRFINNKKVSDSNINQVLKQIYAYKERFNIKATDIGDKYSPQAVVFDPMAKDGQRLQHRMPDHVDASLDSRAAAMNLKFVKDDYLYPLDRIDFSQQPMDRKKVFSAIELNQIRDQYNFQITNNKIATQPDTWKHNQIFYPLLAILEESANSLHPKQPQQALFSNLMTHSQDAVAQSINLEIPRLPQHRQQQNLDLVEMLYQPPQTVAQNHPAADNLEANAVPNLQPQEEMQSQLSRLLISEALAVANDEEFAMEPAAKRVCLSNRLKREVNECAFSWEDVDEFNKEEVNPRDSEKIIIDSELFLKHFSQANEVKRTQLLKLAAGSQISGAKKSFILQLVRIESIKPHLKLMDGIASGFTHGMIAKDILADLLNGDGKHAAINLGFMGGGFGLGKFSQLVALKGERLIAAGENILGNSLILSRSIINRGTSLLVAYDLVEQVNALKSGNKEAIVGVIGDSLMLGSDLAVAGIEVAEFTGLEALAGISSVAGPLGQVVGAFVMLGMQISAAVQSVAHLDDLVHLTGWEKFKEGWRAFLHLAPEEYIQKIANLIEEYKQFLAKKLSFINGHSDMKHYIFSALEQIGEECRMVKKENQVPQVTDWIGPKANPIEMEQQCQPIFGEQSDAYVDFQQKVPAVNLTGAVPINPDPTSVRLTCLPAGDTGKASLSDFSDDRKAYYCNRALGLTHLNITRNLAFFNLGQGQDQVYGFIENPNVFVIKNGFMYYTGAKQNDLFMLQGNSISGVLSGGEGEDTLDLSGFSPSEKPLVDLSTEELKYSENSITLNSIENVIGKASFPESFIVGCNTRVLNTQGGRSNDKDSISIPAVDCDYNLKMPLHPNTFVDNQATQGSFSYIIFPGMGETQVKLHSTGEAMHQFMFNCKVEDLQSLDFQTKEPIDNIDGLHTVHFNFANFVFKLSKTRAKTSVFYFQDGAELKLGDKQNTYIFYNTIESNINTIVDKYPPIANALNMTFLFSTEENKLVILGHGKHEVMQNDPNVYETHLVGNGGENLFVMNYGRGSNVVLYQRNDNDFIDTLDLRPITRQFNTPIRIIPPNANNHLGNDVLITCGFPEMSIRLKNATLNDWHKQLHVITGVAPQKIVGSPPCLRLEPIPLEFEKQTGLVIQAGDVEPGTKIIIPREYDRHAFFRDDGHLRLTNSLNFFPKTQRNTILFVDYFKESKLSTLSIQFSNNVTIALSDKLAEIAVAPEFRSQLELQEKELNTLTIDSIQQYRINNTQGDMSGRSMDHNASYVTNETEILPIEAQEIIRHRRFIRDRFNPNLPSDAGRLKNWTYVPRVIATHLWQTTGEIFAMLQTTIENLGAYLSATHFSECSDALNQTLLLGNKTSATHRNPIQESPIKQDVPLDSCTSIQLIDSDQEYIEGVSCQIPSGRINFFHSLPYETCPAAFEQREASFANCRSVEWYGRPVVACEGEKVTAIITPDLPERIFDRMDSWLMLGQVAMAVAKNIFTQFFPKPVTDTRYQYVDKFAGQTALFENQLKAMKSQLVKAQEKKLDPQQLKWIQYRLEDRQEEFKQFLKSDRITDHQKSEFEESLLALQEMLDEVAENSCQVPPNPQQDKDVFARAAHGSNYSGNAFPGFFSSTIDQAVPLNEAINHLKNLHC